MDGLLLFDKPKDWTSHDAVDFFRSRLRVKKAGHAGTLDPAATGLLLMLIGTWTKKSVELTGLDKEYTGSIRLGVETDSQDLEGKIVKQSEVGGYSEDLIREKLKSFEGDLTFIPPIYSAIKVGGKRAHALARSGQSVIMEPRKVRIDNLEFVRYEKPEVYFRLKCSKGTYVRSIAALLGEKLGCGGTLSSLIRTKIGLFDLKDALREEDVRSGDIAQVQARLITRL